MNVKKLSPGSQKMMDSFIKNFVNKYADGYGLFNETNAKGLGTLEDFEVLGWMYYEGIFTTEEELAEATAYILGRALVKYTGFEWGEVEIANSSRIVLVRQEYNYIFTPLEYVMIRMDLLWSENYDIEDLFFDAIFLSDYNAQDEEVHPLFALQYTEEYKAELGFSFPDEIKALLEKFYDHDSELLVRKFGIEFYEKYYAQDWKAIKSKVKHIDVEFAKKYYENRVWEPIYESTQEYLEIIDWEE